MPRVRGVAVNDVTARAWLAAYPFLCDAGDKRRLHAAV